MRHKCIQHHGRSSNRHTLNDYLAGTSYYGIEESFAAEQHVLNPLDPADLHCAGSFHCSDISGIYYLAVAFRKIVHMSGTVDLKEDSACTGISAHQEALAAEEAVSDLLLDIYFVLYISVICKKRSFLDNYIFAGCQLDRLDRTGERRG